MNALILVDLQNDFMPGGALAVAGGHKAVPIANRLMRDFDFVVATQDWHPRDHLSFASQHSGKGVGECVEVDGVAQILWPDHCIQKTRGAALHDELDAKQIHLFVQKGIERRIDSYSGFFDNGRRRGTGLAEMLETRNVTEVAVMGLATDYCVKFTALDALQLGLQVTLIVDGCRGVDLNAGDVDRAVEAMRREGAICSTAADVMNE